MFITFLPFDIVIIFLSNSIKRIIYTYKGEQERERDEMRCIILSVTASLPTVEQPFSFSYVNKLTTNISDIFFLCLLIAYFVHELGFSFVHRYTIHSINQSSHHSVLLHTYYKVSSRQFFASFLPLQISIKYFLLMFM